MGLKSLIVDVFGSGLLRETPRETENDKATLRNMSLPSLTAEIGRREKENEKVRYDRELSGSFSGYAIRDNKRDALDRAEGAFKEKFQQEVKRAVESELKKR